jgi:hypothetical protein
MVVRISEVINLLNIGPLKPLTNIQAVHDDQYNMWIENQWIPAVIQASKLGESLLRYPLIESN